MGPGEPLQHASLEKELSRHVFQLLYPPRAHVHTCSNSHGVKGGVCQTPPRSPLLCPRPSHPQDSSASYLDKHFLLVHGSHHFSHIGALLLQQLQLLPQQAHCRGGDVSTSHLEPLPMTEGQHLPQWLATAPGATSPAGRTSPRAPGEEDKRIQAIPLAFNSFLCACRRRRFWLFSFTMSCWEKSFAESSASCAAFTSTQHGHQHNGLCHGTGTWTGTALPSRTWPAKPHCQELSNASHTRSSTVSS